jgi:hypothetical protein
VTASAVMTAAGPDGTVHVPRVCQPLFAPAALAAYMKIVFAPANALLNVTARFTVSVVPLRTAELLPSAIAQLAF